MAEGTSILSLSHYASSMTMSQLSDEIEIESESSANVICFGSIPVLLDVAESAEEMENAEGVSLGDSFHANGECRENGIDRSVRLGDENVDLVAEVNGSIDNGTGSIEIGSRLDCDSSDDEERRSAVKIARPLPPVLSSVDERSITLSWMGSATMAVSYEIEFACNEGSKVTNSESDLEWTSASCGEGLSYKVGGLKPGTSYSFRLRVVPKVVPPLVAPASPAPSDIAVFSTLPAAPSQPSPPILVNRARTSLKVKWTAPLECSGLPVEYVVQMTPPSKGDANAAAPLTSDGFMQVYNGKETSVKVPRLLPGTYYRFRVMASNSVGQSQFSKEALYMTEVSVPAAPEAPTLLSASATSMTVEWQEPNDSGSPITDYTLEHDDGEGGPFTSVYTGAKRQYTINGLKSGHVYRVRVLAHNQKGKGSFSKPAELLTNFAAPSPPPTPSISGRSATSIVVTWDPPECDGGSPITAFEMEMKRYMAGWTLVHYGITNTYTVTGLSPGLHIDVRVRAVNLMGKSGWSGEAQFSTLPGPPEAPSAPVAIDVESSRIALGWRPPTHDGGSLVVSYRLEMNDVQQNAFKDDAPKSEKSEGERKFVTVYSGEKCKFEVEGLEPGSTYYFKVQAFNKQGAGPCSDVSAVKTLSAPPATPEPPVIVGNATASSISLRWSSPLSNGASINSYVLQMLDLGYGEKCLLGRNGNISTNGDDLQGGSFESSAGQRDSFSPFSDGLPHSPSHSTSSDSSRGTSTWDSEKSSQKNRTSPSYAGTSEDEHDVQGVLYKRGVDGPVSLAHFLDAGLLENGDHGIMALREVYNGSSTAYTVSKLQPFTSYAFRLQAQNGVGSSEFSAFSIFMTSSAAPCAPCPPSVVETTSSSLTLRWEVPEQDNGSPVCRFTLEILRVRSNTESLNGQKTNSKKSARNRSTNVDTSILKEMAVWEPVFDGNSLQYEASDLLPGQKYTYRVIAHNLLGLSPPSSVVEVRTLSSAPGTPLPPTFSKVTPTSVYIKWTAPARDNGKPVTSYKLIMDDGQGGPLRKVFEGGATSHKAVKLRPASSYRVAVQAINSLGASPFSEESVVELPVAPPPTPPAPKVEVYEEKQAPIMPVQSAKPSLQKELTEMLKFMKEISRRVQEPWSLKTRRYIAGVAFSITLIAIIVTLLYN
jgi:hypothetical protein